MAHRVLTVKSYVNMPNGSVLPLSELSPAEKKEWEYRMKERLSAEMSLYYTQHPEHYIRLCKIFRL